MKTDSMFTTRLIAAALITALGLASPAFASKNESHPENHTENSHDQDKDGDSENDSDDHDKSGYSGGNGGAKVVRATLAGTVEPGARGEVKLKQKLRGNQLEAEATLPVPSAALAVADRTAAQNATLTLTLSRSGQPYAECDFDLKSMQMNKKKATGSAKYKIEIYDRGGVLQERYGICDLDLVTPGVQRGLPTLQTGDAAAVVIDTNNASFLEGIF
ncbi:hypothetical protein [Methylomagnum sp.]